MGVTHDEKMVPSSLAMVPAIHSAGGDIGIFNKGGERVQTAVCICGKCGTPARGGCEKSANGRGEIHATGRGGCEKPAIGGVTMRELGYL